MSYYILYQDDLPRRPFSGKFKPDPTKMYLRHFGNSLYLTFIIQASDRPAERTRARQELSYCERKMDYWKRQPDFNVQEAAEECMKAKEAWSGERASRIAKAVR